MDDLLALMEGEDGSVENDYSGNQNQNAVVVNEQSQGIMNGNTSTNSGTTIEVEKYTRMRIVNRRISVMKVIDELVPYEFHTTTKLASMSQQQTNNNNFKIATAGLVFSNSGTKLSKQSKRAFSILKIGTLSTGPSITVLLFQTAYATHTSTIKPGALVTILKPSILPPSNNSSSDTAISLSIYDSTQLMWIGTCPDYGVCAAKHSSLKYPCRHYVDLRISRYCKTHQHYASGPPSSTTTSRQKQRPTFVQSMKLEMIKTPQTKVVLKKKNPYATPINFSSNTNTHSQKQIKPQYNRTGMQTSKALMDALTKTTTSTTMIHPSSNQHQQQSSSNILLKHASMHMTKKEPINNKRKHIVKMNDNPRMKTNPFLSKQNNGSDINKKRKIARFEDFDGSVQRPKPNNLFRKKQIMPSTSTNQSSFTSLVPKNIDVILEKQRQLAQAIQNNKTSTNGTANPFKPHLSNQSQLKTKKNNALLFGAVLTDEEKSSIMSAKSQFHLEAQAEKYVKSRKAVVDLETKETLQDKKKNQHKRKDMSSCIISNWKCLTCKKVFSSRPKLCIAYKHQVAVQREIQKKLTVTEARLNRGDTGMILGSGLEWSGWKHNTN